MYSLQRSVFCHMHQLLHTIASVYFSVRSPRPADPPVQDLELLKTLLMCAIEVSIVQTVNPLSCLHQLSSTCMLHCRRCRLSDTAGKEVEHTLRLQVLLYIADFDPRSVHGRCRQVAKNPIQRTLSCTRAWPGRC